jgi:hypothetical protein
LIDTSSYTEAFDAPVPRATIAADLALADRHDTVAADLERIIDAQGPRCMIPTPSNCCARSPAAVA